MAPQVGGAILRLGANVRGLTTAASIWAVAGIGMAVGAGMYAAALIATGLVIFALYAMAPFENRLFPDVSLRSMEIELAGEEPKTDVIIPMLQSHGIKVNAVDMSRSFEEKIIRIRLEVQLPKDLDWGLFYARIGEVGGISSISLDRKI
jgi:putative Mg2+ transporter-C (MgtC) family protein